LVRVPHEGEAKLLTYPSQLVSAGTHTAGSKTIKHTGFTSDLEEVGCMGQIFATQLPKRPMGSILRRLIGARPYMREVIQMLAKSANE